MEGKLYLVVDGKRSEAYEYASRGGMYRAFLWPVFSPDGTVLAFSTQVERGWALVVAKCKSDTFDQLWTPAFSPDSKKVAFGARKGRKLLWKVMDVE